MAVSKVILNGTTLIDVTNDTVTAAKLLANETATAANGQLVVGSIASKSSSDLTVSGATVTVPAGYYSSDASKSVASGSATTPATTITANPSITVNSSGLITATASATQSVTPTVGAGYVSSGTAGTITVNGINTSQLTAQAAQTITPTTTDQTIASGKYLTGAQTIKGDANLIAANIKKDVSIFSVTGTYEGSGGGKKWAHFEVLSSDQFTQTEGSTIPDPDFETDFYFSGYISDGNNIYHICGLPNEFSRMVVSTISDQSCVFTVFTVNNGVLEFPDLPLNFDAGEIFAIEAY